MSTEKQSLNYLSIILYLILNGWYFSQINLIKTDKMSTPTCWACPETMGKERILFSHCLWILFMTQKVGCCKGILVSEGMNSDQLKRNPNPLTGIAPPSSLWSLRWDEGQCPPCFLKTAPGWTASAEEEAVEWEEFKSEKESEGGRMEMIQGWMEGGGGRRRKEEGKLGKNSSRQSWKGEWKESKEWKHERIYPPWWNILLQWH